MPSLWPFLHSPVALIAGQGTLLSITAQHTRRGTSARYIIIALCLALCTIHVQRLHAKPITRGWLGMVVASAPLVSFANAVDKFVLRGWDFERYHEMAAASLIKQGKDPKTLQLDKKTMAAQVNEQPRGVGTFWQVPNVPSFDAARGPGFVPNRWDYISQRSVRLPLFFIARAALVRVHFYLASNTPLATQNLPGYIGAQITITWCTWLADGLVLTGIFDMLGLYTALTSPSKLWVHRPLFGPLSESYTIRRFWGVTWHQNLRSWLEGWTSFVALEVFQLPRKGVFQRYFRVLLTFAISGMLHMCSNMGIGIPFPHWPTFWFFFSQGFGIVLEDLVIALWKRSIGQRRPILERSMGFIWVVAFIGLTKPWWQDVVTAYSSPDDSIFSWEMVTPLFWDTNHEFSRSSKHTYAGATA